MKRRAEDRIPASDKEQNLAIACVLVLIVMMFGAEWRYGSEQPAEPATAQTAGPAE